MAKGKLVVRLIGDDRDLRGTLQRSRSSVTKWGAAAAGALAGVGIGAFFKSAIDGASDLGESLSKARTVFGDAFEEMNRGLEDAPRKLLMTQQEALEAAGTFGNLITALGGTQTEAASMSTRMVELAADLASFNNVPVEEALGALRSGLTGETEPLKRFGVALNDAALKEEALRLGLIKTTKGTLPPAIKQQAAYSLILKQTKTAQGDVARTGGGLANQQRILGKSVKELQTRIGQALAPAMLKVVQVVNEHLFPAFESVRAAIARAMPTIREVAARLVGGFQAVMAWVQKAYTVIAPVLAQIFETVRSVFSSIASIIGTVVQVIQALWDRFGAGILANAQRVWNGIRSVIDGVLKIVRGIFQVFASLLKGDWGKLWQGLKLIAQGIWNAIRGAIAAAIGAVRNVIGIALGLIKEGWSRAWRAMKDVVTGIWNGIKTHLVSVLNFIIRNVINKLISALNTLVDAIDVALGPFVNIGNIKRISEIQVNGPSSRANAGDFRRADENTGGQGSSGRARPSSILPGRRPIGVAASGDTVNVTVQGSVVTERQVADVVYNELLRVKKRTGALGLA